MGSRQSIITALKTQLGNISVANGYNTNIGSSVYEWRVTPFEESDLPAIDIRDKDCNLETDNNNVMTDKALSIVITVYGSVTSTAATNARKYIEDVLEAIGKDITLGGNAYQVDENSEELEVEQNSSLSLAAIIEITAYYRVNKWSD